MNYKILLYTSSNIFNNSFYTFLLVLFAFVGYLEKSANIAIAISITILLTQIFSGNMRNIIIASNNFELLRKVKYLRILLSILIIFLSSLFFFLISSNSEFFSYSLIVLIVIGWINEINILDEELNDNKIRVILYLCINFILTILIIYLLLINYVDQIHLIIIFQSIFNFFLFYKKKNFMFKDVSFLRDQLYELKKFTYAFYSSFSMIFANFVSRSLIFLSVDKNLSGILFASYAIGSFPGTIFNNTFGPILIKKKISISNFLRFILVFIFLFLLITPFTYFNLDIETLTNKEKLYFCSILCMAGSFLMVYSLYLRQIGLQNFFEKQNKIFTFDIFLNLFLVLLTLIIIFINVNFIYFYLFFIFSVISILIYKVMFLYLK